jgi:hypothetical protein
MASPPKKSREKKANLSRQGTKKPQYLSETNIQSYNSNQKRQKRSQCSTDWRWRTIQPFYFDGGLRHRARPSFSLRWQSELQRNGRTIFDFEGSDYRAFCGPFCPHFELRPRGCHRECVDQYGVSVSHLWQHSDGVRGGRKCLCFDRGRRAVWDARGTRTSLSRHPRWVGSRSPAVLSLRCWGLRRTRPAVR